MAEFFRLLLITSGFPPLWDGPDRVAGSGWLYIASELAIWGAYTAIAIVLVYLVIRRKDFPFPRIFWLFAAFIFASGTVHLIEAAAFWWPIDRVAAIAKLSTAILSWAAVIAIIYIAPRVLALPGLARINENLTREITERRRAETLLRNSREQLQLILQGTGVGTWEWEPATGRMRWSDTLEAIHGLAPGQFEETFQKFMDFVHPEDRDMVEQTIRRAISENNDFTLEYRINRQRSHGTSWLEMKGHVAERQGEQAVRLAGTCTDITVRKQAEMRFRLTVEASPNAVLLVDRQGRIVLANSRVKTMFGYEPAELVGHSVEQLVPHRFRDRHTAYRDEFHRQPEARPMGAGRDLYALRKDGSEFPVEIGLSPTESDEGLLILATIVDITARKQGERERAALLEAERGARNEAERANRLKDLFLATVSHELRTPLNAILGWSQLLGRAGLEGEAAQAVSIIERNAKVQARLIEDLLDMSRIISGKIRMEMQNVELPIIVNSALEAVLPAAQVKHIHIERNIDPMAGTVRGDANRLQQVVWNLLTNAIKFTPKNGRVSVALRPANSHVELVVSDTGVGIKPESLPFLFDRFRQADGSAARQHAGLGLGLSIVKSLVELHGGTVHAESPGEGQGATFMVRLPPANHSEVGSTRAMESGEAGPISSSHVSCDPQAFNGIKIMVVDDDPDACTLAQRVLEDCGAKVAIARSADEGLEMLASFAPDVLISDISMPGKDGYQLIREVRAREPDEAHAIPAAALTALARPEDRARATLAGYQAHISKPLMAAELIAVVASLSSRTNTNVDISSKPSRTEATDRPAAPPAGQPEAGRVLLVEDNPEMAETFRRFLAQHGFAVEVARSVQAAVQLSEAQSFDLVISDVALPDGSGISLMRQLRSRRPISGIALSSHESETLVSLCQRAGFREYLVKPVKEQELLDALQRVLGQSARA